MSENPFGPGEIELLHSISLEFLLSPSPDGRWLSPGGVPVPANTVNALIEKGFAKLQNGQLEVTDEGRSALSNQLDLTLKSIPEWLLSVTKSRRKTN